MSVAAYFKEITAQHDAAVEQLLRDPWVFSCAQHFAVAAAQTRGGLAGFCRRLDYPDIGNAYLETVEMLWRTEHPGQELPCCGYTVGAAVYVLLRREIATATKEVN